MPAPVHVLVNGDGFARSVGEVNYTYYDHVEGRIESIDTAGGPIDGGTWVRITGRLLADLRRQGGDVPTPSELPPPRLQRLGGIVSVGGLTAGGDVETRYEGALTSGGAWTLHCRFGRAGHVDAVLTYEASYAWDPDASMMRPRNYSGTPAWEAIPLGRNLGRPRPVVWCRAPRLYGTGRAERVTLDLTLNGQVSLAPLPAMEL